MMILALYVAVQGEFFASRNFQDQNGALYLAEAGVMDAIKELEADPSWSAGFNNKSVSDVPGTYTVVFNTTGSGFTPLESVNNSDGTQGDNFRGAGMVPAGHVSVICEARVGMETRVVEALIRVGGGLYNTDAALVGTGKITMRGNVRIDGRAAIGDSTVVDGDLHSDLVSPDDNLVTWDGSGMAIFEGQVSSSGSAAGAIDLATASPTGGTQASASQKNSPDINILGKISANSGAPAATVNSTGTTTLSPVGAGTELYHSGDLIITNGDLELNGVTLYVDGKVDIKGSITGEGSIYVAESTKFEGDARILAATPDKVGIFSEGNVHLSGFDGSQYMNDLASNNPAVAAAWGQLGDSLQDYHTELSGSPAFTAGSKIDALSMEISGTNASFYFPVTVQGRQNNVTQVLLNQLAQQPPTSQRNKMMTKFQQLNDLFYSYANGSSAEAYALANLQQGRLVKGAFDAAIDNGQTQHLPYMQSYVDNIDYDSLGSAYFQGLVFTHGSFYADSELTVLGALVTKDNGTQSPVTIGSENLDPGDVVLATDTKVRYIEEFFQPKDPSTGTGGSGAQVALWIGR